MIRTAISIKVLPCTSTKPNRLVASTMSARPVSVFSSFWAFDSDDERYAAALEALLSKLGDGWGKPSDWRGGNTNAGRVYVRN